MKKNESPNTTTVEARVAALESELADLRALVHTRCAHVKAHHSEMRQLEQRRRDAAEAAEREASERAERAAAVAKIVAEHRPQTVEVRPLKSDEMSIGAPFYDGETWINLARGFSTSAPTAITLSSRELARIRKASGSLDAMVAKGDLILREPSEIEALRFAGEHYGVR